MNRKRDRGTGETISRLEMEKIIVCYGLSVRLRLDGVWGTGVTQHPGEPTTIHLEPKSPSGDADPMDFFHELSHVLLEHSPQRRGEDPKDTKARTVTAVEELEAWALTMCLCVKWGFTFQSPVAERFLASYGPLFGILLKVAIAAPKEALRGYMTAKEFRPDFQTVLSQDERQQG